MRAVERYHLSMTGGDAPGGRIEQNEPAIDQRDQSGEDTVRTGQAASVKSAQFRTIAGKLHRLYAIVELQQESAGGSRGQVKNRL